MSGAHSFAGDSLHAIISGAIGLPDSLHAIISGAIRLADTARVSGDLHLVLPHQSTPGWVERWGISAALTIINAAIGAGLLLLVNTALQDHKRTLDKQLEDYKLGPASILALFTHRAGVLSEVQLEATRKLWAGLVDLKIQVDELTGPPTLESLQRNDIEVATALFEQNRQLAVVLEKERAFLPPNVYDVAAAYFNSVRLALKAVAERHAALHAPNPTPEERRAELAEIRQSLNKERGTIDSRYDELATRISKLIAPELPKSGPQ